MSVSIALWGPHCCRIWTGKITAWSAYGPNKVLFHIATRVLLGHRAGPACGFTLRIQRLSMWSSLASSGLGSVAKSSKTGCAPHSAALLTPFMQMCPMMPGLCTAEAIPSHNESSHQCAPEHMFCSMLFHAFACCSSSFLGSFFSWTATISWNIGPAMSRFRSSALVASICLGLWPG